MRDAISDLKGLAYIIFNLRKWEVLIGPFSLLLYTEANGLLPKILRLPQLTLRLLESHFPFPIFDK